MRMQEAMWWQGVMRESKAHTCVIEKREKE
jgi:hypothetical protein